jgi:NAD-dependent SIR2 family protein deacetylase
MRFVDGGPDIPETLLRAHLAGEVVFVVGAGLSQNAQLPDFKTLVERVYRHLNLDFPPSVADYAAEKDACDQLQWDRLLGMVEERVGDLTPFRPNHRNKVRQAVSEILAKDNGDVSAHANLLRIATDRFGRPRVVTTNFDTLFERAWGDASGDCCISIAGPGLPAVTARDFAGILHLHGRLAHGTWGETDLVLSSSDFGEAYLRSGWAARFIYDLLRRFTVVFIGYSADDPPMRYMLEAAFSGRFQFPDMKRAYAIAEAILARKASSGRDGAPRGSCR